MVQGIDPGISKQEVESVIVSKLEPLIKKIDFLVESEKKNAEFRSKLALVISIMYQESENTKSVHEILERFLDEWFNTTFDTKDA